MIAFIILSGYSSGIITTLSLGPHDCTACDEDRGGVLFVMKRGGIGYHALVQ